MAQSGGSSVGSIILFVWQQVDDKFRLRGPTFHANDSDVINFTEFSLKSNTKDGEKVDDWNSPKRSSFVFFFLVIRKFEII